MALGSTNANGAHSTSPAPVDTKPSSAPIHVGRLGFELALLGIAIAYTVGSFRLPLHARSGDLGGAGFFPQVLGIALIFAIVAAIAQDARTTLMARHAQPPAMAGPGPEISHHAGELALQILLLAAFLYLFSSVNVWVSTTVYVIVGMVTIMRPFRVMPLICALLATLALIYVLAELLHASLP